MKNGRFFVIFSHFCHFFIVFRSFLDKINAKPVITLNVHTYNKALSAVYLICTLMYITIHVKNTKMCQNVSKCVIFRLKMTF
jgi:hypothetical protein